MLTLINISKYDSCRSLALPDVVCGFCFEQRDLDLLREAGCAQGKLECSKYF